MLNGQHTAKLAALRAQAPLPQRVWAGFFLFLDCVISVRFCRAAIGKFAPNPTMVGWTSVF